MDYQVYKNHVQRHRDLLRERENDRLAKQAANSNEAAVSPRKRVLRMIHAAYALWQRLIGKVRSGRHFEPIVKTEAVMRIDGAK